MNTVGDLARMLVLRTHQSRLNGELDTLAVEVATGFVSDPARHLGGDISGLLAIDRSLAQLETFRVNATQAGNLAGTMQTTLDEIQSRSEYLSQTLSSAALTPTDEMLQTLAAEAESSLDQMTSALNRSIGGRFLFSGTATDQPAMTDGETILTELRAAVAGETTAAGIEAELDAWFDTTGGGFETIAYLGSQTSLAPLRLGSSDSVTLGIRADDQVFRDMLKAAAKAVLATDDSLALSTDVQTELLVTASTDLLNAQTALVETRAELGATEARIEENKTRNAAEDTALSMARLELVGADQYESAARYQNTLSQLESLYAMTARSSRMSLVEFL